MKEMIDFKQEALEYREQLVETRRHIHRHPELSFKEINTAKLIRERLKALDIPMMEGISGNSTVGILKGSEPGPTLLFRADIDALPITENTGLEFASEIPGVMHACGHDAHTSTLLAFADWMSKHRDRIRGTVKLVFQQGEDQTPGGGKFIVADGVLKDVDYAFAWHCAPEMKVGELSVSEGPRTAAVECYRIRIHGVGGHGGFPFMAVDPISTGAEIVSAINQLINWTVSPFESATLTVSRFEAGTEGIYNVVPADAVLEGHLRSLNNDVAKRLLERIQKLAEGICEARGCTCEFEVEHGYPALINDEKASVFLREKLQKAGMNARKTQAIMGAEDFAFYTMEVPGVYFNSGVHNPNRPETAYAPHNPKFCIDEDAMVYALEAMLRIYDEMTTSFDYEK